MRSGPESSERQEVKYQIANFQNKGSSQSPRWVLWLAGSLPLRRGSGTQAPSILWVCHLLNHEVMAEGKIEVDGAHLLLNILSPEER